MSIKNTILDNIIAIYITSKTTLYTTLIKYAWIMIGIYLSIYPWFHYTFIHLAASQPIINKQIYNIFAFITYIIVFLQFMKILFAEDAHTKTEDEKIIKMMQFKLIVIALLVQAYNIIEVTKQQQNIKNAITHSDNVLEIALCVIYIIIYTLNISSIICLYIQTHQKNIYHINECIKENQQKSQHAQQQLIRKIPKFAQKYFVEQYICKNNIP